MIKDKESVREVIRMMLAGKVAPVTDRKRYYFYSAPPEYSIQFSSLKEILSKDSPEKKATIEKLKGGNSGKYHADYFIWKKVVIVTNEYTPGAGLVAYEVDITPSGSKVAGSEKVYPTDSGITAEQIEKDNLLFEDKRGDSNILNIDKTLSSYFIEGKDPPQNILRLLVTGAVPPGKIINYEIFNRILDEYRIWSSSLNQLLSPDFEVPTADDVPGGHYAGGEATYKKIVSPYDVAEKEEVVPGPVKVEKPEPETGTDKPEDKAVFEPVGEKPVKPEQGQYLDRGPTGKTSSEKGDYSSKPYAGGFDVMQRLVEDQKKDMKLRKMAREMILGELKEVTGLAVNTQTQSVGKLNLSAPVTSPAERSTAMTPAKVLFPVDPSRPPKDSIKQINRNINTLKKVKMNMNKNKSNAAKPQTINDLKEKTTPTDTGKATTPTRGRSIKDPVNYLAPDTTQDVDNSIRIMRKELNKLTGMKNAPQEKTKAASYEVVRLFINGER